MHPKYEIEKSYKVTCDKPVLREHLEKLRKGVQLEGVSTAPADVYALPGSKGKEVGIVIHEGRNRQVRKMFETLGYDVRKLDRVAYGPVTLEGLPRGRTRRLSPAEVRTLRQLAGLEPQR
jgi:23S rRNA pseudouridine2605 synthase